MAPDDIAEGREKLHEDGYWIGLAVRLHDRYELPNWSVPRFTRDWSRPGLRG